MARKKKKPLYTQIDYFEYLKILDKLNKSVSFLVMIERILFETNLPNKVCIVKELIPLINEQHKKMYAQWFKVCPSLEKMDPEDWFNGMKDLYREKFKLPHETPEVKEKKETKKIKPSHLTLLKGGEI